MSQRLGAAPETVPGTIRRPRPIPIAHVAHILRRVWSAEAAAVRLAPDSDRAFLATI
jgi:hypothetical protein